MSLYVLRIDQSVQKEQVKAMSSSLDFRGFFDECMMRAASYSISILYYPWYSAQVSFQGNCTLHGRTLYMWMCCFTCRTASTHLRLRIYDHIIIMRTASVEHRLWPALSTYFNAVLPKMVSQGEVLTLCQKLIVTRPRVMEDTKLGQGENHVQGKTSLPP